ncbi:Na+/H+ antiporter subunit E [Halorhodospira halophila]|uniref:Multisubunit sodium/proton antiporter, MrpE subunit n=1 Tax=Halorhodospira halophila (strain DSM 244 / SL1) TaxID=349124 RepID=A1WV82_HALHL|nr:Na+/H+ antiporter subunit E [Halorhodospira halophila]ABM61594.1 conserved hypothetical protein [Halorhodospira halophila SL1]MBK1729948.1 hypothetical protein [Halorhodospira halophila]
MAPRAAPDRGLRPGPAVWLGRFLRAAAVLLLLWLILAEGAFGGVLGAATVLAAAGVGVYFAGRRIHPWYPLPALRFAGFFLVRSLIGAVDVGYRAVHPRMPIHCHWLRYAVSLPGGEPRVALVAAVSLLPGTLAADLRGDILVVHAITPQAEDEVAALERRVAAVYGLSGTASGAAA